MSIFNFARTLRIAERLLITIVAGCMFSALVLTVFATQKFVDHGKIAAIDSLAARVLMRAVDVADQTAFILHKARRLNGSACSAQDIDELRLLSFESRFVRDVARLENTSIACSAAWGRLEEPFKLPTPHHGIAPYRFWRDINTSPKGNVHSDLTAYGAIAVVAAPGAFDDLGNSDASVKTLVTSRDGMYVFRSFGITEELMPYQAGTSSELKQYSVKRCHSQRSICVVTTSPRTSVLSAPSWLLFLVSALGILAGAGIGLMVCALMNRHNALAAQLKRAIENDAIRVVYQPIRMLDDRRLVGVEALARWSDARGQNIPPDQFIPLAEELGLLDALTRSVLRTTFRELGDRLRADHLFYVSVNVNSEEMISQDFRAYLHHLCSEHSIPASRVALEVTERSTSDYADLSKAFLALRDAGHMIMIDDFGTGYSNFAHLAALPLDAIKMDRAFTNAIGTDSLASEVITGIMSMATGLNVTLIVEGIETEEQVNYLKIHHPQARGQGWLLGRPSMVDDLSFQ